MLEQIRFTTTVLGPAAAYRLEKRQVTQTLRSESSSIVTSILNGRASAGDQLEIVLDGTVVGPPSLSLWMRLPGDLSPWTMLTGGDLTVWRISQKHSEGPVTGSNLWTNTSSSASNFRGWRKPMRSKQLRIPGLEVERKKPPTAEEQIAKLAERVLNLELEVSLLRILVENPREGGKDNA